MVISRTGCDPVWRLSIHQERWPGARPLVTPVEGVLPTPIPSVRSSCRDDFLSGSRTPKPYIWETNDELTSTPSAMLPGSFWMTGTGSAREPSFTQYLAAACQEAPYLPVFDSADARCLADLETALFAPLPLR